MLNAEHVAGQTFHGRHGAVANSFRYSIDYILVNADAEGRGNWLFGRNAPALMALHDRDHGGPPGHGRGVAWVREVLADIGLNAPGRILLLTQPRVFGHVFNPVSFWLVHDRHDRLNIVIAEVSNTFGDRHSYLCHRDDLAPITRHDVLSASKIFHVSPFQPVEGEYAFRFDISSDKVNIRIEYATGNERLIATLTGPRQPLTKRAILSACLKRPMGSRRVLGLIHWQALRLWWKGAAYRARPEPPVEDLTR